MKVMVELADLTPTQLVDAVKGNEEDALRDLLLARYKEAEEKGMRMNFYYAYYVACSSDVFDMFSQQSLQNLFELHGYETAWVPADEEQEDEFGYLFVRQNGFEMKFLTIDTMHDSLIANFIDAKTAVIVREH